MCANIIDASERIYSRKPAPKTLVLNPTDMDYIHERFTHAYILAMSGMGKTEIMKIVILGFHLVRKSNIIVIDLNGDLSRQIARSCKFKKDIVYIDMINVKKFTPIHNPLRTKHRDIASLSIMSQELFIAIKSIIGTEFTVNMEAVLIPCIYTLLLKGDSGIDELITFMDNEYNEYLIDLGLKSSIKAHRDFFRNQFTKSKLDTTKDAIATKLQILLNNPLFANFIIGKSTINLESLMNSTGKIIIFRLPKSMIPAAKLLMASIQGIALKRVNFPEEMRAKTYLFLDEFQNFVSPTLQELLSESRKYKLSVICAHQNLSQIDMKTRDSLMSNTHIKIVGNNSIKDLKLMSDELEIDVSLLKNLNVGEFYFKVGNKAPAKIVASDKFIGDKGAIPELQWKQHLKYWKKHYYKKVIDTTKESVDVHSIDDSNTSLPIPKYDTEK